MEQKAKRIGKFNIIDIIAVILILAVLAFVGWKLMNRGGGADGGAVIAGLDRNLPAIIQKYTPVTLERDLDRHIRAVAHA